MFSAAQCYCRDGTHFSYEAEGLSFFSPFTLVVLGTALCGTFQVLQLICDGALVLVREQRAFEEYSLPVRELRRDCVSVKRGSFR
jgi:hypothetical protein